MPTTVEQQVLDAIHDALEVPAPRAVLLAGDTGTWRGPFAVDALASATVAAASAAAASLLAARRGQRPEPVHVQRQHAALAYLTEGLTEAQGWQLPSPWDPIAGDYRARTAWLRLHTNYPWHRKAALQALELADTPALDRERVAAAVAECHATDLESRVVQLGGVAGEQRSVADWARHPQGIAVGAEPLLARVDAASTGTTPAWCDIRADQPFSGIRVLDLTRVLAGPVASGFLAAWGADVLRIDPVDFSEVAAIVPVTTAGKRCASLDLRTSAGRAQLLELAQTADVLLHGYRSDALARLGLTRERFHADNPGLVIATLDAWGWTGPWATRRGFDSIVQHGIGITLAGQQAVDAHRPRALPCQALDHGTGWLLAAAVCVGLERRLNTGRGCQWRASLARTGQLLFDLPRLDDPHRPMPDNDTVDRFRTTAHTPWGPLRRLSWPGRIGQAYPRLGPSTTLGSHVPEWRPRAAMAAAP